MSKKTFSAAPKPSVNQPSLEAISAFEQGGAGTDAPVSAVRKPAIASVPDSSPEKPSIELEEPTRRLSLDLPASVHKRFKTACSATDRKMTAEVLKFIQKRTSELEKRASIYQE